MPAASELVLSDFWGPTGMRPWLKFEDNRNDTGTRYRASVSTTWALSLSSLRPSP